MTRVIYIPGIHAHVTLHQYCTAWKMVKANPDATYKTGICQWWPQSGRQILRDFTAGVHDRINLRALGKCLMLPPQSAHQLISTSAHQHISTFNN